MGQIAVKQKLLVHCFLCSWRAFVFSQTRTMHSAHSKANCDVVFVQTSNVTWNWKCRCWIPFFFIWTKVHCWVFIVENSFFLVLEFRFHSKNNLIEEYYEQWNFSTWKIFLKLNESLSIGTWSLCDVYENIRAQF